jgi:uncharacterized LabA/DUF88 family protein
VSSRIGLFVDFANISMNGGYGLRADLLRRFVARDGGQLVRLNAYLPFDSTRAETDSAYRAGQLRFHDALRDNGFKVMLKTVRWFEDAHGARHAKADCDMDIAVDMIEQADRLDTLVLASGDGDFARVAELVQARGARVEVIAFRNVSRRLRGAADAYTSGYLVPGLVPPERERSAREWGVLGGYARGICYQFENGFGFVRFLPRIAGQLWTSDSREADSPWQTCFLHGSQLPPGLSAEALPSRDLVLEFDLEEGDAPGRLKAVRVNVAGQPRPESRAESRAESRTPAEH